MSFKINRADTYESSKCFTKFLEGDLFCEGVWRGSGREIDMPSFQAVSEASTLLVSVPTGPLDSRPSSTLVCFHLFSRELARNRKV